MKTLMMDKEEDFARPQMSPALGDDSGRINSNLGNPSDGGNNQCQQSDSEKDPNSHFNRENSHGSLPNDKIFNLPEMEDLVRKDLAPAEQQKIKFDQLEPAAQSGDHHTGSSDHPRQPESSGCPDSQEHPSESLTSDIKNCEFTDQCDSEMPLGRPETLLTNNEENMDNANAGVDTTQSCPACKDICLEDFEMAELSDSNDSSEGETESLGHVEEMLAGHDKDISSHSEFSTEKRSPSPPPCVLRHRLEPEPPRTDNTGSATEGEEIKPKSSKEIRKLAEIQRALDANPVDVETLRRLAISPGGLVNKHMRQRVWPLLINVNTNNIPPKPEQEEMEAMTKTYNQVVMDVNRSSSRFPPGIDDHVRMSMKDKLVDLIMRVMLHHKGQLKYYQVVLVYHIKKP
ncbi:TBC1 domain family member 20 [Elysia marginata]|uniref:TBC1 domain family member 20 n=1 Tax=Elysia marginata TaxID=1093978 RepID=A0AAV4HVD8_9GAST|nr:TBC1 domain family member 20 [Elysia marginata]